MNRDRPFLLRLSMTEREALDALAVDSGLNKSDLLRQLIRRELERMQGHNRRRRRDKESE